MNTSTATNTAPAGIPVDSFVERYTAWADSFTDAPVQFHRFIAYWVLSTLLARRVYMRQGTQWIFPNLWMVILAPSSFYRKSTAIGIGADMVRAITPEVIMPSEWSHESFIAQLAEHPHGAMICYEFKGLLSQLQKDYNAGSQSLLTELYDNPHEYKRTIGTKERTTWRIEQPYLTILGASTIEWLINSVKGGDIAGGFLARFLFVSADKKDKIMAIQPPADEEEKDRLVEAMKTALNVYGEMKYTPQAIKFYESWYHGFVKEAESAPEAVRAFFPRLTAYAHKFAMLEAVLNGHGQTITEDDCHAACMLADDFAAEIRKLGRENLGKDRFALLCAKIVKAVNSNPKGVEHSHMLKNSNVKASEFKDAIATLMQTREIVETRVKNVTVYMPGSSS